MIPLRKKNNFFAEYLARLRNEPYLKINLVFAGVILLLFLYSGFFSPDSNNYPVVCIQEKLTGKECFSCGLSHSFSLILRGRIDEAYRWNQYGMRVFLFFFAQLFMRMVFSVIYLRNKDYRQQLVLYDIAGSILIFLITFYPFFRQMVISIINH
jgi:hypothetical protein